MRGWLRWAVVGGLALVLSACSSTLDGTSNEKQLKPELIVLGVTLDKTAQATTSWTLGKEAFATDSFDTPVSELTVPAGSSATLYYKLVATRTFGVEGNITVTNATTHGVAVNGITDTPAGATSFALEDCSSAAFPVDIAAGESATCGYSYAYPEGAPPSIGADLTNTAQADVSWDGGSAAPSGTATYSYAAVPAIDDVLTCPAGFVCTPGTRTTVVSPDGSMVTVTYRLQVDNVEATCGEHLALRNDAAIGEASDSVSIDVYTGDCAASGCTGTVGHWKNHPDDPKWDMVGDTAYFFDSGISWMAILESSVRGSAYLQLAQQYIAAKLSLAPDLTGPSDVMDAIAWAEAFFPGNAPFDYPANLKQEARAQAAILEDFNSGDYPGWPHCGS